MVALSLLPALAVASTLAAQVTHAMPSDDQVAKLFSRQATEVGSAEWKAQYPPAGSIPKPKQEWVDALAAVVKQGKIPNIPVATLNAGWPSYSDGVAPSDPGRCHYTVGCVAASDFINAPDGYIGISQDDGPLPPGRELNEFFKEKKQPATHFYIGANVVANTDIALQAREIPDQTFGVHSWTHGYSSGQTNEELLGELGWTMQVLADMNGGRIPSFWRPPFGDVDNRVRAIASEVFGLHTIIWNQDSADWTFGTNGNMATIQGNVQGFVDGPKSPGLMMLQHELYDNCVTVFKNVYPSMVSQGWNLTDIPGAFGLPQYKNALTGSSAVDGSIGITNTTVVALAAASQSSAAASSSSAASSSAVSSAAGSVSSGLSRTQSGSAERSASAAVASATNAAAGSADQANAGPGSAASPVVRQAFGAGLTLAVAACVASLLG